MKNLILPLILIVFVVLGCNSFRKSITGSNENTIAQNTNQRTGNLETPVTPGNSNSDTDPGDDEFLNEAAISLPAPVYPPTARAVRAGGKVVVEIEVSPQGSVVKAEAVSGHPLLRAAAVAAARQAKFKPSPETVSGSLEYEFKP